MQIIVVSDNHGDQQILKKVLEDNPNASFYLHLGDSEMFEYELSPFITIKGNNDYYIDKEYRIINFGKYKAYMTHGHKMYLSEDNMVVKSLANECKFFIFGHIHQPFVKEKDNVYLLCPGSLAYPRSSYGTTYIRINIEDENISIEVVKI